MDSVHADMNKTSHGDAGRPPPLTSPPPLSVAATSPTEKAKISAVRPCAVFSYLEEDVRRHSGITEGFSWIFFLPALGFVLGRYRSSWIHSTSRCSCTRPAHITPNESERR